MSEQKKQTEADVLSKLVIILFVIGSALISVIRNVVFQKSTWTKKRIKFWFFFEVLTPIFVYAPGWNVPTFMDHMGWIFPKGSGQWVYSHLSLKAQLLLLELVPICIWFLVIGVILHLRNSKYNLGLEHLGLSNATGTKLKVMNVVKLNDNQKKVLVKAKGFDIEQIRSKKNILESALNEGVHEIDYAPESKQIVEIIVSQKNLTTLVPYDDVCTKLEKPYSFLVGQGYKSFIVANLAEIYHMMIAGGSGYGKSSFVKQFLIGLLQSSKHLQVYILDLKLGLEAKAFKNLENVYIAKESISAVETMRVVVKEMERRFNVLESNDYNEIDCKRDKMDRIVVLIDEASEIFTLLKGSKAERETVVNARELSDRIAKMGRVAGIHLVVATQKVIKETIDTRTQVNINARMIFRTNTQASSVNTLGDSKASKLPSIAGRGYWAIGDKQTLVQTPMLTHEDVKKKVQELAIKFNGENSPLFQPMLCKAKLSQTDDNKTAPESKKTSELERKSF